MSGGAALAGLLGCLGVLVPTRGEPFLPLRTSRFDLENATAERFTLLPGLGSVLADRIVETRRRVGGIESVEDLAIVNGIGPRTVEAIRPIVEESFPDGSGHGP